VAEMSRPMKRSMRSRYEETSGNSDGPFTRGVEEASVGVARASPQLFANFVGVQLDFQMASLPPAVLTTSAPSGPETLHAS